MKKKKITILLLAFMLVFTSLGVGSWNIDSTWADSLEKEVLTDEEAVSAVYDFFNGHKVANPIDFPYGEEENQFTNLMDYVEAKISELAPGKDVELTYTGKLAGTVSYIDYADTGLQVSQTTIDDDFNVTPIYADGISKPALTGVYIKCGEVTSEKINQIYFGIAGITMTEEEILDFEAKQLVFKYIRGKNTDANSVTQNLGVLSTTVGALPTDCQVYKTDYKIKWEKECISGDSNALTIDNSNKTTVTRPEVGENDSVIKLKGTVYKTSTPSISKTSEITVTIPAYKGIAVPIQVSPSDAKLSLKLGSTEVEDKYIEDLGNGKYIYTLHGSATDGSNSYTYTASKDGYISTSGKISVNPSSDTPETTVIKLKQSSEEDCYLESLVISSPAENSASIVNSMETFSSEKTEYNMVVTGALPSVIIKPTTLTEGATIKVKYYSNAADATKDTYTEKPVTSTKTLTCHLKDYDTSTNGKTVITIEVTAPESSTQQNKTKTYVLNVTKNAESAHTLKSLTLKPKAMDDVDAGKNTIGDGYTEEQTLSPGLDAYGLSEKYEYQVNYFYDKITLTPTANSASEIKSITVAGKEVASGTTSETLALAVGNNKIEIVVEKTDSTKETYNINVYRKPRLEIKSIQIEDDVYETEKFITAPWTGTLNFPNYIDTLSVKIQLGENEYLHFAGETTKYYSGDTVPIGSDDSNMKTMYVCKEIDGSVYAQKYVISFKRRASNAPSSADSYLPAPGQFVNLSSYYSTLEKTVAGPSSTNTGIVTLGAFGGNVVYYFDEAITDDPNNPYGVDFTVFGNVFANADGSSAEGAMEPAAVMVSEDGETWYELAGSEYYNLNTERNVSITYENPDQTFASAVDVPWTMSTGDVGYIYKNNYHAQAYYPQRSIYANYQSGKSANQTYTDQSVSFTGTRIESTSVSFGYGDSHFFSTTSKNIANAVNPYRQNHLTDCNGDGFDLAWAVDEKGLPVKLSGIHYIKIYTAVLKDGGTSGTGEVSSEINGVLRAESSIEEVGKTEDLKALTINGTPLTLKKGTYTYEYDAGSASSIEIVPEAETDSNIYVNNKWTSSAGTVKLAVTDVVRIIVQNGEKEPSIYHIKISGENTPASNAELDSLQLTPGDKKIDASKIENDIFTFNVSENVEKISLTPVALNKKATIKIGEKTLKSGEQSELITLQKGNNSLSLTVTSEDGKSEKTYTVNIYRENASSTTENIRVYFKLTGDTKHGANGTHTPLTWISGQYVEIPKGSTVKYITELMLYNNNISFVSDGVYISSINGLEEFDNGSNSGWMYKHNGIIADVGYASRVISDGDTVEWFYTDDYTKETGYENNWNSGDSTSEVTKDVEASVTDKKASASVSTSDIDKLVENALEKSSNIITLNITGADKAEEITVEIPKESLLDMASKTNASLTVATSLGNVQLQKKVLSEIAKNGSGNTVQIVLTKRAATDAQKASFGDNVQITDVKVLSDGKELTDFGENKIKISLPVSDVLKDKTLAVAYIDADGKLTKISGKTVTIDEKTYFQFETSVLGNFALGQESKIDGAMIPNDEPIEDSIKTGVQNTTLSLKSTAGKGYIKLNWSKSKGYKVDYYEVYRSTKRYSGYGKTPYFTTKTKKTSYKNTKELKKSTRYYYKVRGVRIFDGKKIYTKYSNKAWRNVK